MKKISTEICVIGSGPAAYALVRVLVSRHYKVCVIEAGSDVFDIGVQDAYRGDEIGVRLPYSLEGSRLRFLGGSSNCWSGGLGRFSAREFSADSSAGRFGWPINLNDLLPYYERVEKHFGISEKNRNSDSPVDNFEIRWLNFTKTIRLGEQWHNLSASGYLTILKDAPVTGLVWGESDKRVVRAVSSLRGISVDADVFVMACGGIENARLLMVEEKEGRLKPQFDSGILGAFFADHPIAPCATVFPSGCFNSREFDATVLTKQFGSKPDSKLSLPFFRLYDCELERRGLLSCGFQIRTDLPEINTTVSSILSQRRALLKGELGEVRLAKLWELVTNLDQVYESYESRYSPSRIASRLSLRFQMEQASNKNSKLQLTNARDNEGRPRIQLDWQPSELDYHSLVESIKAFAKCFRKSGLGVLHLDRELMSIPFRWPSDLRGGQHHCGTTRMSEDPGEGVVDSNLLVHGTDNLYVVGSSVFPSNSWVNPTLTIMALSDRLGGRI